MDNLGMPKETFADFTPEQLKNVAERHARIAAQLQALATSMELSELEKLRISKHNLYVRSVDAFESWLDAGWKAFNEERTASNAYGTPVVQTKKK